jgi:calcineurin-like phosphoesterase family protein
MTTYYTSDLHFGHRLVAGKRQFWMPDPEGGAMPVQDTEAHDAALIENWNKIVKPWDEVWVLGDLTLRDPRLVWHLVDQLFGTKHFVTGNHDACFAGHRGAHKHQREYRDHFETVQPYASVRLEGQPVMLSHFPYIGDGEGKADRCAQWRLRDCGAPVVHGHTHRSEQLSRSQGGTLQIHVGLDAHGLKPVPESWIMKVLREEASVVLAV